MKNTCKNHYELYSHPCVDGNPMSNKIGYVCIVPEIFEGKAFIMNEFCECELKDGLKD